MAINPTDRILQELYSSQSTPTSGLPIRMPEPAQPSSLINWQSTAPAAALWNILARSNPMSSRFYENDPRFAGQQQTPSRIDVPPSAITGDFPVQPFDRSFSSPRDGEYKHLFNFKPSGQEPAPLDFTGTSDVAAAPPSDQRVPKQAEKKKPGSSVDSEPKGTVQEKASEWSNATSQAMIAAGLALMRSSGKTYKTMSEANASGMNGIADAVQAGTAAYSGTKSAEAQSRSDQSESDLKRAYQQSQIDKNLYEMGDLAHKRALELKKTESNTSLTAYQSHLVGSAENENDRKASRDVSAMAYKQAAFEIGKGLKYVTNPQTGEQQLVLDGAMTPAEKIKFDKAFAEATDSLIQQNKTIFSPKYINNWQSLKQTPQPVKLPAAQAQEPTVLIDGKRYTRAQYEAKFGQGR
jgi:hypothetical protein